MNLRFWRRPTPLLDPPQPRCLRCGSEEHDGCATGALLLVNISPDSPRIANGGTGGSGSAGGPGSARDILYFDAHNGDRVL